MGFYVSRSTVIDNALREYLQTASPAEARAIDEMLQPTPSIQTTTTGARLIVKALKNTPSPETTPLIREIVIKLWFVDSAKESIGEKFNALDLANPKLNNREIFKLHQVKNKMPVAAAIPVTYCYLYPPAGANMDVFNKKLMGLLSKVYAIEHLNNEDSWSKSVLVDLTNKIFHDVAEIYNNPLHQKERTEMLRLMKSEGEKPTLQNSILEEASRFLAGIDCNSYDEPIQIMIKEMNARISHLLLAINGIKTEEERLEYLSYLVTVYVYTRLMCKFKEKATEEPLQSVMTIFCWEQVKELQSVVTPDLSIQYKKVEKYLPALVGKLGINLETLDKILNPLPPRPLSKL